MTDAITDEHLGWLVRTNAAAILDALLAAGANYEAEIAHAQARIAAGTPGTPPAELQSFITQRRGQLEGIKHLATALYELQREDQSSS